MVPRVVLREHYAERLIVNKPAAKIQFLTVCPKSYMRTTAAPFRKKEWRRVSWREDWEIYRSTTFQLSIRRVSEEKFTPIL